MANAKGKVVQVIGSVVDFEFPPDKMPALFNAIEVLKDGGKLVLVEDASPNEELDLRNGTYHETEVFLLAVLEGRALPAPSLSDAMIATELADELMRFR